MGRDRDIRNLLIAQIVLLSASILQQRCLISFPPKIVQSQARWTSERRTHMSIFAHKQTQQGMNIVLVHGAWADGSSWSGVIERLQANGYNVSAPQFPMSQLSADVARLRQVLARQNGPTIVVGHSYG